MILNGGGHPSSASFAFQPGEDQVNFMIPHGVTVCNVFVAMTATIGSSTVTRNYISIAIDPTLTCSSQEPFPPGFKAALASGSVRVVLIRSVTTSPAVLASGSNATLTVTGDQGEAGFNKFFDLPYGPCIIVNAPQLVTVTSSPRDPGSVIDINGPGSARQLTESTAVTGAFYNILGGSAPVPAQRNTKRAPSRATDVCGLIPVSSSLISPASTEQHVLPRNRARRQRLP